MAALSSVGRYLYAIPMGVFGLLHFLNTGALAGMVPIPGGAFWVYLTGVALLAAAVAIIAGKYAVLATQLLGVMLLIFVVTIHLPGVMAGGEQMMAAMPNLLKDTALAGGAWILSGVLGAGRGTQTA